MSIVAFTVIINNEQATTNYFRSIVDKTKWGQIIRIIRDNEEVQDNCSDTSKQMNSNLIKIIQIFQILMYVNFKIIGLKWQEQYGKLLINIILLTIRKPSQKTKEHV
jgi:hypothetical protein